MTDAEAPGRERRRCDEPPIGRDESSRRAASPDEMAVENVVGVILGSPEFQRR